MRLRKYFLILIIVMAVGCAEDFIKKNYICLKINETEAKIFTGNLILVKGDKVSLYRYTSAVKGGRKKVVLGTAEVKNVSGQYAVVQVLNLVPFREGNFIEKIQ